MSPTGNDRVTATPVSSVLQAPFLVVDTVYLVSGLLRNLCSTSGLSQKGAQSSLACRRA
jgi:hypothetical protein